MAKRSSRSIMEGWMVRSDSGTASSDTGYSSGYASSAGENKKPASAAPAGKKQRSEPSMAMAAAASSAVALISPQQQQHQQEEEEEELMMVCRSGTHYNAGAGTSLPLECCKIKLSKASGLATEDTVEQHLRRINKLNRAVPSKGSCDMHLGHMAASTARQNAAKKAALKEVKLAAQEAVQLEGGLAGHPPLTEPQLQAKCGELSAPGSLLHYLATNDIPFNINMGFLDCFGGCGPDGTRLVPKKLCRDDEGYGFTTARSPDGTQYRATATDPGSLSVSQPKKYFKIKVIYVSKWRCNAGEVEERRIRLCMDEWKLPNLINKARGGWAQTEPDARWQSVSITYLDLSVAGADKIVFHQDAHNALA
ncbi:hypothetical protein JKP88DRAFT_277341 [Tribonema minus]|uniref:Uncharacterized protein n=1 Tax=Tribonema minus TaxID=303371 RepID=A0A835Z0F9_9STRA|nr:hypothetical protein JKP88DRAFT_277341 [Tribonema minus]